MRNLLFAITIILAGNAYAQSPADSLEALLPGLPAAEKPEVLNELSFIMSRTLPEKSLAYAEQALELAETVENDEQKAEALVNIGKYYRGSGDYDKALEYLQQAFSLSEEIQYKKGSALSLSNIGVVYDYQSDYDKRENGVSRRFCRRRRA